MNKMWFCKSLMCSICALFILFSPQVFAQENANSRKINLVIPDYRFDTTRGQKDSVSTFEPLNVLHIFQDLTFNADSIFVFNSYDDFIKDNGSYLGTFNSLSSNATAGDPKVDKIYASKDGVEIKINPYDYYGFRINNYWFVNKTLHSGKKIVLICLKEKGKIFYANGFHYLCSLKDNAKTFSFELDKFYYSDDINSIAKPLNKFRKDEKGEFLYESLIKDLNEIYKFKGDRYDLKRHRLISEAIMAF